MIELILLFLWFVIFLGVSAFGFLLYSLGSGKYRGTLISSILLIADAIITRVTASYIPVNGVEMSHEAIETAVTALISFFQGRMVGIYYPILVSVIGVIGIVKWFISPRIEGLLSFTKERHHIIKTFENDENRSSEKG